MSSDRTDAPAATPQAAPAAERRNVLQNALAAIERLQSRLDAVERARHEPIAIVGMACRLPGGVYDTDAFWQLLTEGRDAVGEVPADRWNVDDYYDPDPNKLGKARTKAGAFLDQIDQFEPSFFGMSPREAAGVDPQQRLLLETTWEAMEHAGIPADQLDGSLTGVFVGITSMDYADRIDVADPARSDIYLATGTALNAAAGRVSFTFGFRGPCMAIDTACSSSLVAIHTACQSLRDGESNLVVAGGVNAIMSPDPFVLISKWGMLSPDGRCKTFDASANGFVRGEGCGLVVLERLSDAVANGRRILGVIPGSAINQDGRSSGLTVPNGLAQQEVVGQALAAARLKPADVSYVEAHGTGTSLGDPIEVEALAAAYGEGRRADEPLQLGSVKSNIGHLEAASGVASLMKLTLALQHRQLPASLHVKQLTPSIPWASLPVRVSTALHEWTLPSSGRRIAGVSAFGFSGMNAHVLVEEAPPPAPLAPAPERALFCLPVSARNDAALAALATRYADHLEAHPDERLADVCATLAIGRSHLPLRTALVAADREDMDRQLRDLAGKGEAPAAASAAARHRVAFLFTGQGSQWAGMGRELYDAEPVFRATIERCAAVLDPLLGRPLQALLFEDSGGLLDQTGNTQPALFAIEVAMAATWRAWGIEPTVVIGHSVGEFAAAVVAGVFSLEDGARLIAARGRLMQALPAGGAMVSVQGDVERVKQAVAAHADKVSVAAFNAPGNVVIAGAGAEVNAMAADLAALGMRTQALTVSHAFHSPLMDPMVEEFRRIAEQVVHHEPRITWVSNLDGAPLDWSRWSGRMAEYWARHVREPVAFEAGAKALGATNCDVHLEVGPHPTLIGLGMQCLAGEGRVIDWLPSLKRGRPAWATAFESVARLYTRGARLDWRAIQGPGVRHSLALPTYPFQRQRFLVPFKTATRRATGPSVHELLGTRLSVAGVVAQFERVVDCQNPPWVADHRIASEVVMPLAAYLEAALSAVRQVDATVTALDAVEVGEPMPLPEGESRLMQVVVDRTGAGAPLRVRVFSRHAAREDGEWALHASALASAASAASAAHEPLSRVAASLTSQREVAPFYDKMRQLGADFGEGFRGMRRVWCGVAESIGEVELAPENLSAHLMHPALMDACFHVSAVALDTLPGADDGRMYLPIGVERYHWYAAPQGRLRSHAKVRPPAVRGDMLLIDIQVETMDGQPVAFLEGMRCRRASRDMFRQRVEAQVAGWLYELAWEPQAPTPVADPAAAAAGRWLVFDEGEGRGERLADALARHGAQVVRVVPKGGADADAPGVIAIDPADAKAYADLVCAGGEGAALRGVVSLWPLRVPALDEDDLPSTGQALGTEAALLLLQGLAAAEAFEGQQPRLWIVTRGSQSVDGTETLRIEQAPVAGLARVAASEHPEWRVTLVDLDPEATPGEARLLADEVLADSAEPQVALRKGVRHAARLARRARPGGAHVDDAPIRLHIAERGTLENLHLGPAERRPPGPGQVEIRVRASGLNFRDVLSALGMYPGEIKHLGSDCAGEVVALGEGVTQFQIGDRVVAMADGSFASHATTRWEFVAPLPAGVSFEQGAAIPTAYLTADVTLNLIAGMRAGQRVLIHSGAGGVGMAAIALARRAGAEIFATAGSPEKREVLRRLGVHHVLDSRSASFADEIARITGGKGVDIVLNSLAGELMDRSFESLADGGVFLEIGKRGLWTHERVAALNRGLSYHIVDCNDNARDTPQIVGEIFTRVLKDIESGVLPWLPLTTFAFEDAPDAFRFMAQARHIGRVVFRHTVAPRKLEQAVREDASYLVTGGLKGLGLVAARWLAAEGAHHLVLAGRSEPDAAAREAIAEMAAQGVSVRTVAADVSSAEGVAGALAALQGLPPLGGVIHCAGVLDDGVLIKQSTERFAKVMGPKADGAWRLHVAMARAGLKPDFFVLYSSLSAVFGSAGQGNYVAANAFLDALARRRREADLPALSVNWGAWSEVGMAARGDTAARAGAQGLAALSPKEGMQALDLLMREGAVRASAAPIDWALLSRQMQGAHPPLLSRLLEAAQAQGSDSAVGATARVDYASLPPAEREQQLLALVRRELATVLGLAGSPQSIPVDQGFPTLGLDSLTSVELRNRLQQALGRTVAATAAFEWPTVQAMAGHLSGLYGAAEGASTPDTDREEMTL
ncbi:MAG: SDR family NAD(P)-dependent oxidoreductase [Hydrogenophaga sp.]|uniref:type I polyketide synthase n=1 Tax=Hydrogenophaga sp. TaxID=1904254 RepID=UPI00169A5FAA|nr:type I polyketide synthase [Hydrogenophaga sp.]NIM40831.1 SDR family NAD(P)-dependent oxidoreductase [Hydrogenophaga sp.]NIN26306.1 SDR family NAD(P)-dependent oxidoreductase [Hydrogenophaga sp.]NIN31171.1 SDR family NAD(P)-dependent oxidoreductase [Hydrogenophaga sp.]NIN55214.1 SDR family NAD(P)-dependent oxidoreductase [Hydrogenophaga sp.]NIO51257.1 SDR family NAD(P)-dependent oxidoreductase [Hydrogenophaga sp.]